MLSYLKGLQLQLYLVDMLLIMIIFYFILSPCCCSVTQSCPTLCNSMECNMPGLSVPHYLLKLSQVHVHGISDATQPSHPLTPSSPPTLSLSQHWGLFQ